MKKILFLIMICLIAMAIAVPAFAGQEPYVAVVKDDINYNEPYISEKESQWLHAATNYKCEEFKSHKPITEPDLCNFTGYTPEYTTSLITQGNSGRYQWKIVLPKKPEGDLNVTVQCAILKPNETDINNCAGITGENVAPSCKRGSDNLKSAALPMIKAVAYPGPFADTNWKDAGGIPFNLTAMKNPSSYSYKNYGIGNTSSHQVLDMSTNSRIALKGCFTKTIFVAMPSEGRTNALGQIEHSMDAGDLIVVTMQVPAENTVDIYCHQGSVKVNGIGEPATLLADTVYNPAASCPSVSFDE